MKKLNKLSVSTLSIALAVILIFGGAIGGTIAWLTAKTGSVTNVFTIGKIQLTLTETNAEGQTVNSGEQTFLVTPGSNLTKDPTVTVGKGSVASYVFVKIDESAAFTADSNISYTVATGWTALNGETGVYYREVAEVAADAATEPSFPVLADNTVTVADSFDGSKDDGNGYSLTFTAYGIQKDNLATAADAWAALEDALA